MSQSVQYLAADGDFFLNVGGSNSGPDGLLLQFTITGTNSLVLYKNTAPPGSAVSLTSIPFLNASLAAQSAGTAITASGLAYVTPESASFDLYATLNWTSGSVVVRASTANLGASSGGGGTIPAADVTAGTFGANTGETEAYAVPGALSVTGVLSTSATTATLAQSGTTAAVSIGTGTGTGATTLNLQAAADQNRLIRFRSGTAIRWELGANGSANLTLNAYDDSAVFIDAPFSALRAAGGAVYTAPGRPWGHGGAPGGVTTDTKITKAVSAIADNVATTVLTVTVPNVAASGVLRLTAMGALGAGGAIGAREAVASNSYDITFTRTAGVAAVADISTAWGVNAAAVAGAATCTAAITVAAVAGAVGATNTFPIQVTIVKSAGASDNHTCTLVAEMLNCAAGGITVA